MENPMLKENGIPAICSRCLNELQAVILPDETVWVEPCETCVEEAFNKAYEEGYDDRAEEEYWRRFGRRIR